MRHGLNLEQLLLFSILTFTSLISSVAAHAQGSAAFTYQGQLQLDGQLVSGQYDFRFTAYDGPDPFLATALASDVVLGTAVLDGIFTVEIDLGPEIFDGRMLWLQTEVRQSGTSDLFALSPLQKLTPVPYSTFAINAAQLDGLDSSDFVQQEVDPTLPPAVQSGCKICLGWADGNDPDPDVERCHNLSTTGLIRSNFVQFSGDVDENDRMWLWIECL